MKKAINAYKNTGTQSGVAYADPHTLIKMLFDGLLSKLSESRGHLDRKEIKEKGEKIGRAMEIIEALKASLDIEAGGELAENLFSLYDYCTTRLVQANIRNDSSIVDEVYELISEIRQGWMGIPKDVIEKFAHKAGNGVVSSSIVDSHRTGGN